MSCSRYEYTGTHGEISYIAIIIPFGDAEAAYFWAVKDTSRSESGMAGSGTGVASGSTFVTEYIINGTLYTVYGGGGGSYLPPVSYSADTPSPTKTTQVAANKLSTSTGVVEFTPPSSMSPFFAGEPFSTVEQTFDTRTSIEGACFGHGAKNLLGFDNFVFPPPFIGWA
jgi:hypothetical protein